jgi:antitoxin component YwqK of YwqJK toxin-antitoxin module
VGEWEWRHENGALREKGTFENGEEIGRWQSWYPNGSEAGVGNYANGMRTGEWQWKRDNGEVWRKTVFVEGRDQTYRSESDETDE